MFTEVQRGLFPIVSIPCMILFYQMFKFGKRSLIGSQLLEDRLDPFYSYLGSSLLAQFLFQVLPNATGPMGIQTSVLISLTIMIGFYIITIIVQRMRLHQSNHNYVAPEYNSLSIVSLLDRQSMEIKEYLNVIDPEAADTADNRLTLADEAAEIRKRRKLTGILMLIMTFMCTMEGFYIVYREPTTMGGPWLCLILYWVQKLLQTMSVSIMMIHALFQCNPRRRPNLYVIGSIFWTCVVIGSTMPAVVEMSFTEVFAMVNHIATSMCYAFAGGVLLFFAYYYIAMDRKRVDSCDLTIRQLVFLGAWIVPWVVEFFI